MDEKVTAVIAVKKRDVDRVNHAIKRLILDVDMPTPLEDLLFDIRKRLMEASEGR